MIDERRFRVRTPALVPSQHRAKALFLEDHVSRVLGGYLRGQLTLAVLIGVAAGVGTGLLGLPYAVVLGVLAGLFELVPMFGPILSVVSAIFVALFMPFSIVGWVILFFLAIQQVENNVLAPRKGMFRILKQLLSMLIASKWRAYTDRLPSLLENESVGRSNELNRAQFA